MREFLSWWLWRRWRIYCPKRSFTHLYDQDNVLDTNVPPYVSMPHLPYRIMEYPSRENFQNSLFHWDEAFVSPCSFNENWCGGIRGKWVPKIQMLNMPDNDDGKTRDEKDGY